MDKCSHYHVYDGTNWTNRLGEGSKQVQIGTISDLYFMTNLRRLTLGNGLLCTK